MRLILDNVSERDYEWLISMAKSLKFKVAIEEDTPTMSLKEIDSALNKGIATNSSKDSSNFGIGKEHIKEFQQRKKDYLSGKDQTTSWNTIKQGYGLV